MQHKRIICIEMLFGLPGQEATEIFVRTSVLWGISREEGGWHELGAWGLSLPYGVSFSWDLSTKQQFLGVKCFPQELL